MSTKARLLWALLIGASVFGQTPAKPVAPRVPAAHYRVCVKSDQGEACSATMWTKKQAEAIELMFVQAPIPCYYAVGVLDTTTDRFTDPPAGLKPPKPTPAPVNNDPKV